MCRLAFQQLCSFMDIQNLTAVCSFVRFARGLQKKKVGHIRIDGNTPQSARQTLVTRFQENDNVRAAVVCAYIYHP